jgi:quinol monooxygenase YgiN
LVTVVTIIANYRAKLGSGDRVAAILAQHVALTRAEAGCIEFFASRSTDDPDVFVLYEQYVSEEALQRHRETPHFRRYIEGEIAPLLIERTWKRYLDVQPSSA